MSECMSVYYAYTVYSLHMFVLVCVCVCVCVCMYVSVSLCLFVCMCVRVFEGTCTGTELYFLASPFSIVRLSLVLLVKAKAICSGADGNSNP